MQLFKAYELDAQQCKEHIILFKEQTVIIADQINKDIEEYGPIKFSIGLSLQFVASVL